MNRDKFIANEKRERLFTKAGWRCKVCGRWLREGQPQLAHKIPATKPNLAKYGKAMVHHELNLVPVCSLRCNDKVLIGQHHLDEVALVAAIMEALENERENS